MADGDWLLAVAEADRLRRTNERLQTDFDKLFEKARDSNNESNRLRDELGVWRDRALTAEADLAEARLQVTREHGWTARAEHVAAELRAQRQAILDLCAQARVTTVVRSKTGAVVDGWSLNPAEVRAALGAGTQAGG